MTVVGYPSSFTTKVILERALLRTQISIYIHFIIQIVFLTCQLPRTNFVFQDSGDIVIVLSSAVLIFRLPPLLSHVQGQSTCHSDGVESQKLHVSVFSSAFRVKVFTTRISILLCAETSHRTGTRIQ